jgi:nucleoside-diphosphate-sugar epimerase
LIYGPAVKGNLYKLIRAIAGGYFPFLQDSYAVRSMVGVDDVANALVIAAMHSGANRHPLIVSDGEPYTLYRIHCEVLAAMGLSIPGWILPLSTLKYLGFVGDGLHSIWRKCPLTSDVVSKLTDPATYSAEQMRSLGWQPTTTFYKELPIIINSCMGQRS